MISPKYLPGNIDWNLGHCWVTLPVPFPILFHSHFMVCETSLLLWHCKSSGKRKDHNTIPIVQVPIPNFPNFPLFCITVMSSLHMSSLGSLKGRRGYCYDYVRFNFPYFNILFFLYYHSMDFFSLCLLLTHYSWTARLLMRIACAYSYTACLLIHTQYAYSSTHSMLTHSQYAYSSTVSTLTHAQP
jgi:hypothetical protein